MYDYNTLSTAEYIDSISGTYDDYIESWFSPRVMPKESHKQETEANDTYEIIIDNEDLPF